MWQDRLKQLAIAYPEALRLESPATEIDIKRCEDNLGVKLGALDPSWLEFLKKTNGARILDYTFMAAKLPPDYGIVLATQILHETNPWAKSARYISLLSDTTGMDIGFVRKESQARCIVFLSESSREVALPIASSSAIFMTSFLEDVGAVLNSWDPQSGKDPVLFGISDYWPFDLQPLLDRDPALRTMLESEELGDLFESDEEYVTIINNALKGTPQNFGRKDWPWN